MIRTKTMTFADRLRHYLNPLHLYCRICDLGISEEIAMWIVKKYEAIYML